MLGIFLLVLIVILMILFVVASFLVSKLYTTNVNMENNVDSLHDSIVLQMDKTSKPPK